MKIIKRIIIILLILVATPLIVALFVKKEYAVQRTIVINKPNNEVFQFIKYLKNQDQFSKWNQMDPNMQKSYAGTDGTVGFAYSWKSANKNLGQGSQTITKIQENQRVDMLLHFIEPFDAVDTAYIATNAVNNHSTQVVWGFNGSMSYPMNIMLLCFDMNKEVGADLETGLQNLKRVLEK